MNVSVNRNAATLARAWTIWACLPVLAACWPSFAQAQIKVDRCFPPVVSADAETVITAEGKLPKWPPEVFCDRADVQISPTDESGKLKIHVDATATSGVAWIRLYDEQSASPLFPLLITRTTVSEETEPNDKRSQANAIALPVVVAGRLAKSGDSDAFRVSLKAGQQLVATITANEVLKSPMDAVLQLTDLDGNVLAQLDDVRGLDPQIVYTSKSDQDVIVRTFAFPETPNSTVGFGGSASFIYVLDVTTDAYLDHVADVGGTMIPFGYNLPDPCPVVASPATSIAPPTASIEGGLGWSWGYVPDAIGNCVLYANEFDGTLPAVLIGHITKPKEKHAYSFPVIKGAKYRADVRSKSDGFLLDSQLTITDHKSGTVLASNDDVSRRDYDAGVDFTAKEDGVVDVTLSDIVDGYGPRHFYRLRLREHQPRCRLTVAEDHFVLDRDKPLEIPITIERIGGSIDKVQISAVGLPEQVTAETAISEPKGDTSKSVKLKLTTREAVAGHGTFQIVGTALDDKDQPTEVTTAAKYSLRPAIEVEHFWWTLAPKETEKATTEEAAP